jgi:uncharacterized protein
LRALDTNILVYAEIASGPFHAEARRILKSMAEGTRSWAIPWPCIYEYLRIVSHPRTFHPPFPLNDAILDLKQILNSPSLQLLHETPDHWEILERLLKESGATGNLIHDAHIAALCLEHGVSELFTADRDFARFPSLKVRNPFA